MRKPFKYWTIRENVIREFNQFVTEHGAENTTSYHMTKKHKALYKAISMYHNGFPAFAESIGFEYAGHESWTEAKIKARYMELYNAGEPVNYSYLKENYNSLALAIARYFGSMDNLCNSLGIDYKTILIETSPLFFSPLGRKFEKVLDNLFTDLGIHYSKYGSGYSECRPDYIFSPDVWADAKLSASTKCHKMRIKYLKHCKELTVYYLIKDLKKVPTYRDGTKRVHVYTLLENAPESIKTKYTKLFKVLEEEYYKTHEEQYQKEAVA